MSDFISEEESQVKEAGQGDTTLISESESQGDDSQVTQFPYKC
mgnify:CR=1 FL=1